MQSPLARFRLVAFAEGASFLLLLGVAMPLKYLAGQPMPVRVVGMIHGLLFLAYVAVLFEAGLKLRWSLRRMSLAFVACLLPFGPFIFDARFAREDASGGPVAPTAGS